MTDAFPTSPEEALTALEAGLQVLCADGSRLWKSVDGQYHYDPKVNLANASQLIAAFRAIGKRVAPTDTMLSSDDLFTLLIVILLCDAQVVPVESGGVSYIETTREEPL